MSVPTRTVPIAIAPKPAPGQPYPYQQPPQRANSYHQDVRRAPGSTTPKCAEVDTPGSAGSLPVNGVPPCAQCRRRSTKCVMIDTDEGTCQACQVHETDCSLAGSPPPRKRKLDDFDEEGRIIKQSPGRYDTHRHIHSQHSLSSTAASSSLIEDMANFGGPTLLSRTLGLQEDRYSQYIGPTTDFEPSLINLSVFDPQDESLLSRGTLRKVSDNETFLLLPDSSTPDHGRVRRDIDDIERTVSPYGRRLVNLYFRVVHPAFPIIQKTVFLEKYERSTQEFSPPLLAAVYILAMNWWDQDEELSRLQRPNVRELERLCRISLADAMNRPKLSTVQAGLLLSQRPQGDQWAPTAQLIAIAQELGLHLDCSTWKIPLWERGLRKRLAWGMYMQDKWGALVHGRPSHIFPSNWAVQGPTANDFPDVEWEDDDTEYKIEIERGRTLFMQMVQLTQILAEIQDTFYTLQATQNVTNAGAQGTHLVLSLAKPIQLKLKDWYAAIPAAIRMDSTYQTPNVSSASNQLSSIGYLHLAYYATEITLHRRIIRSLAAVDEVSAAAAMLNGNNGPSNPPANDSYLVHICRSAAKARLISAMDFVNRLTPNHLRAFWYFASKTNFALIGTFGSLLWATSPGREEAEWYRRRLGEYRWTLSVSSSPGAGENSSASSKGLTEFAMGMLDISTGLLRKLPEKPSMSRSGSTADLDGARRQSLLALSGTGMAGVGSGFAGVPQQGLLSQSFGASVMPPRDGDGGLGRDEEDDLEGEGEGSSGDDEDVYGTAFSATAGLASLRR